jgi:hypothetical protein
MLQIFGVTLPYFALIACGWLAAQRGVMGGGAPRILNDFVLVFALPALMVRTIGQLSIEDVLRPGFIAAWGCVSVALFAGAWLLSGAVLRQPGKAATIHAAATAHGNVGYLGISLVIGLLGPASAAPVAMAIIFDMLVIIPAVIALVEVFGKEPGAASRGEAARIIRASAANPFVLAIAGGLLLSLSGLQPPGPVDDFLRVLGQAAVPAALFAIGVTLYGQPMRAAVGEIGALCAGKLLLHPVLMLAVASRPAFGLSREEIAAAILLAALPVANNVFVIATRHDARPGRVSGAIFASTCLALGTFNLWAWLLQG